MNEGEATNAKEKEAEKQVPRLEGVVIWRASSVANGLLMAPRLWVMAVLWEHCHTKLIITAPNG